MYNSEYIVLLIMNISQKQLFEIIVGLKENPITLTGQVREKVLTQLNLSESTDVIDKVIEAQILKFNKFAGNKKAKESLRERTVSKATDEAVISIDNELVENLDVADDESDPQSKKPRKAFRQYCDRSKLAYTDDLVNKLEAFCTDIFLNFIYNDFLGYLIHIRTRQSNKIV